MAEVWLEPFTVRMRAARRRDAMADYLADEFEGVWKAYPMGTNGKGSRKGALDAFQRTCRGEWDESDAVDPTTLYKAVKAYAKQLELSPSTDGRTLVKHAQTFFGPDAHWRDALDWEKAHSNGKTGAKGGKFSPPMPELADEFEETEEKTDPFGIL